MTLETKQRLVVRLSYEVGQRLASTLAKHSAHNPTIEGLNPAAGSRLEKMAEKKFFLQSLVNAFTRHLKKKNSDTFSNPLPAAGFKPSIVGL
jgi:hypothetical protein